MKKLEIATGFAQYKILLAILGVLTSLLSFEVFKWNKERHEKYIAQKEQACQQFLNSAERYIESNRFLKAAYYASKTQEKINIKLDKPGITTQFKPNEDYILMYDKPVPLIPNQPRYEGGLFEMLSRQPEKYPPQPLIVTGKRILGDKAEVISVCSPQPFIVPLENLYETTQQLDITPYLPPFSSF